MPRGYRRGQQRARLAVIVPPHRPRRRTNEQRGLQLVEVLRHHGHRVNTAPVSEHLTPWLRRRGIEMVINTLPLGHPDVLGVHGLCELLQLPLMGASLLAVAIARDRVKFKELLRLHNLPTPTFYLASPADFPRLEAHHGRFGFPAWVRSSVVTGNHVVSLQKVHDMAELRRACTAIFARSHQALVERYIAGRRISVALLRGRVLGMTPCGLTTERAQGIAHQAQRACEAIGLDGAARVELVLSALHNESIVAIDPAPTLERRALFPRLAQAVGLSFEALVESMVGTTLARIRQARVATLADTTSATSDL